MLLTQARAMIVNAVSNRALLQELANEAAFALLTPDATTTRQEIAELCALLDDRNTILEREADELRVALAKMSEALETLRARYEALHTLVSGGVCSNPAFALSEVGTDPDLRTLPLFESHASP